MSNSSIGISNTRSSSIQPNFAYKCSNDPVLRALSRNGLSGVHLVEALVRALFYTLDRHFTGCPKPDFLDREERFNGFVFLEGRGTNPHVHILLSCHWYDQLSRYQFLLRVLDNVPLEKNPNASPADIENELQAWMFLYENKLTSADLDMEALTSILTTLAPAGTAKVQLLRSQADAIRVIKYNTKTWNRALRSIENAKYAVADDMDTEFWELRDNFPPLGSKPIARCYTMDPLNPGRKIYDPSIWRISGGRILRR